MSNKPNLEEKTDGGVFQGIDPESDPFGFEKHAGCDENSPSTVAGIDAGYWSGFRHDKKILAVCDGCGTYFRRHYTTDEIKNIGEERDRFRKLCRDF